MKFRKIIYNFFFFFFQNLSKHLDQKPKMNYNEQEKLLLQFHAISIMLCFYKISCRKCNLVNKKSMRMPYYNQEEIETEINNNSDLTSFDDYFEESRRIDDDDEDNEI